MSYQFSSIHFRCLRDMVDTMHVPHVNALLDLRMSTFEPVVTDKNP